MSDGTTTTKVAPADVQARPPSSHLSLSRVGVTGVEQVVRIRANGSEQLFYAELDCFVDLGPEQKGAHMSRFEEVIEEAIEEVVIGEAFKAETLAAHIAEHVRERQKAERAEATVAARYPEYKPAPISAGDVPPARLRRGLQTRHPPPRGRRGPGDDRLPVRSGDDVRPRPRPP